MDTQADWIDWAGGDCPAHLQPGAALQVCTWRGDRYCTIARLTDWRGRKEDRGGIAAYRVVPPPTPAAKARENAFYNAGYGAGLEDDGDRCPDWGDGPSVTPIDELINEHADAKWARPFRVPATNTAWAFIDVSEKDYAAYVEGHETGFKDAWRERDNEDDEHDLLMWQKAG